MLSHYIVSLLSIAVLIALHIAMVCIMIIDTRTIPGGMTTFMGTLPLLMLTIDDTAKDIRENIAKEKK